MSRKYPAGRYLRQIGAILDVDPHDILQRHAITLSADALDDYFSTGAKLIEFWNALLADPDRPGVMLHLAQTFAKAPFVPQIFAFSCAETVAQGLARLAEYKPLVGPIQITVERQDGGVTFEMVCSEPDLRLPPSMCLFQVLYTIECARNCTGTQLTPQQVVLPGQIRADAEIEAFLGGAVKRGPVTRMVFCSDDAMRPLITRSNSLWETLEPGFLKAMEGQKSQLAMSERVRGVLMRGMVGRTPSVDAMARHLNLSRRSLQRRLNEEGTNFQTVLNAARNEMAKGYLQKSRLSLPEIAYLLGFKEVSSFFRAFQTWTGMTPGEYRLTISGNDTASGARQ